MLTKLGRFLYGDKTYYITHVFVGFVVMSVVVAVIQCIAKQPLETVLALCSYDIIGLSASLLGFQLAGVTILISLDGNKKLSMLKKIDSSTMIYKIFISSMTMFLISIIFTLVYLSCFSARDCSLIRQLIGYASVCTFTWGLVFLCSSIRLLKWFCTQ